MGQTGKLFLGQVNSPDLFSYGPGPGTMGFGSVVGRAMWRAHGSSSPDSQTPVPHTSTTPLPTQGSWEVPRTVSPRARRRPAEKGHVEERAKLEQWAMGAPEEKSAEKPASQEICGRTNLASHSHFFSLTCLYLCPQPTWEGRVSSHLPTPFYHSILTA